MEYSQNYFAKYMREYRKRKPEVLKRELKRIREIRIKLLEILGGAKCSQCGFDKDTRAIQIDHKDNQGAEDARTFKGTHKMYRYYLKNPEIAKEKL